MVYRDQKESDDLLDKLVASTRSPHGRFTAEKSWPLLQKRIQGGFGWYLWYHRVASLAAIILLCLAGWGIYEYVIPPREQTYAAYAEVRTILLPDSTEVTLNRYSTLTCPVRFKGKNRNVSLSGEAYFEVRKDARHPFIVQADEVEVKVLGTHFNLEAYPDDPEIKTTLLEGAVAVTSPGGVVRLSPNEADLQSGPKRPIQKLPGGREILYLTTNLCAKSPGNFLMRLILRSSFKMILWPTIGSVPVFLPRKPWMRSFLC